MLVVAECRRCGRRAQFYAEELATFYGRGRDPLSLRFRCTPCASTRCSISLVEQSFERTHERIVWRPVKVKER